MPEKLRDLSQVRQEIVEIVKTYGYEHRTDPFELSSGEWSHDYIDGKRAISEGQRLRLAAEGVLLLAEEFKVQFDAVGGLTMGADPLAHAISVLSDKQWFSVRKQPKSHGRQSRVEGAELRPGQRVLLVDDVVTTGSSILKALDAIQDEGIEVALAVALVDRGETARPSLKKRGVRFEPLTTYKDLGIEPVAVGRVSA